MPRRVFFVHIMKTAGNSVAQALAPLFPPDTLYPVSTSLEKPFAKSDVPALLDLEPARRDAIRFFSVHMPAWVADEIAPDALRVTVLREPVARTVSHLRQIAVRLKAPDLGAVYADAEVRSRLGNYQTRMFALSHADWDAECRRVASIGQSIDLATMSGQEKAAWATALELKLATGVQFAPPLDASHLGAAIRRLESWDVVGTTEALDAVLAAIGRSLDVALGPPERLNVATGDFNVPDDLLETIKDDNELDLRLYAAARELSG